MITLFYPYGDHSNRLIQNLHFEAFCIENSIEYANPTFSDISKYYVSPVKSAKEITVKFLQYYYYPPSPHNKILSARILKSKAARCLIKLCLCRNAVFFKEYDDKNQGVLKEYLHKYSDVYVAGWCFRVHDLITKHHDLLIERYTIKEEYYRDNRLYSVLMNIDRQDYTIIGVHIRRGDYDIHYEGKFYFEDDVYKRYMLNLEAEIAEKTGKKCVFIIFSNEATSFKESGNIYVSKNNWYVDHFLMSKCDLLIGPPSTFTLWASYIGKNRYFHFRDDSGKIDIDDFKYSLTC